MKHPMEYGTLDFVLIDSDSTVFLFVRLFVINRFSSNAFCLIDGRRKRLQCLFVFVCSAPSEQHQSSYSGFREIGVVFAC